MNKYKALITDIDGTLTPIVPNSYPSAKVVQAIRIAQNKGYTIYLASGRPFPLVQFVTKHIGSVGPCIVDNGAVIADSSNGKVLWEALLSRGKAEILLGMVNHFPLYRVSCDIGALENPGQIPPDVRIRKISVHNITPEEADELAESIGGLYKDVIVVKASSYKDEKLTDLYVSDSQATKQHAVLILSEILDIPTSEFIGIGDGYNDFSLLMACGLKVAMGNAVDELKAIADVVAPSVADDGVAYIIGKYLN